jgi:hypothetical protein
MALIILAMCVFSFLWTPYQSEDLQTYITDEGDFSFKYPAHWQLDVAEDVSSLDLGKINTAAGSVFLEVTLPFYAYESTMLNLEGEIDGIVRQRLEMWKQVVASNLPSISNLLTNDVQLGEVNSYSYAFTEGRYIDGADNLTSTTFIAVDLKSQIALFVITAKFEANEAAENGVSFIEVIESIEYRHSEQNSGNVRLPNIFSREVGQKQRGQLTFFYPDDWYTTVASNVVLQNTPEYIDQTKLQTGEIQVIIFTPDQNANMFFDDEMMANCKTDPEIVNSDGVIYYFQTGITAAFPDMTFSLDITPIRINGQLINYFILVDQEREILYIATDLELGEVVSLLVISPPGEIEDYTELLLEIAYTMQYDPITCKAKET